MDSTVYWNFYLVHLVCIHTGKIDDPNYEIYDTHKFKWTEYSHAGQVDMKHNVAQHQLPFFLRSTELLLNENLNKSYKQQQQPTISIATLPCLYTLI